MSLIQPHVPTESIDLGHNHFTGVVPSEVGSLRRLEYLSLDNNDFRGRLPREIGLLNNMSEFNKQSWCMIASMRLLLTCSSSHLQRR
jgi:hypothetical protein